MKKPKKRKIAYLTPGDPNITPNGIRELQKAMDRLSDSPVWRHKIIVLPPGSKIDVKKV